MIVHEKYPDLPDLIRSSESMKDPERQMWFEKLVVLPDDKLAKLRTILLAEKEQLAKLDQDYAEETKRLDKKHAAEWEEFNAQKREPPPLEEAAEKNAEMRELARIGEEQREEVRIYKELRAARGNPVNSVDPDPEEIEFRTNQLKAGAKELRALRAARRAARGLPVDERFTEGSSDKDFEKFMELSAALVFNYAWPTARFNGYKFKAPVVLRFVPGRAQGEATMRLSGTAVMTSEGAIWVDVKMIVAFDTKSRCWSVQTEWGTYQATVPPGTMSELARKLLELPEIKTEYRTCPHD